MGSSVCCIPGPASLMVDAGLGAVPSGGETAQRGWTSSAGIGFSPGAAGGPASRPCSVAMSGASAPTTQGDGGAVQGKRSKIAEPASQRLGPSVAGPGGLGQSVEVGNMEEDVARSERESSPALKMVLWHKWQRWMGEMRPLGPVWRGLVSAALLMFLFCRFCRAFWVSGCRGSSGSSVATTDLLSAPYSAEPVSAASGATGDLQGFVGLRDPGTAI